jgi:hypothetical protein
LEWLVAIAKDVQQGLRISGIRVADNGDLSWLRRSIRQRLEPLAKAQRILTQHGLHLSQGLVRNVDITRTAGEAG